MWINREYIFQKKTKFPKKISCSEILYFLNSSNSQSVIQSLIICYYLIIYLLLFNY